MSKMANLMLKWKYLSPDSDLRVHYRPNMAHFTSESVHNGLKSCIFLKGLTVSSVVIGYLLTKHFVIGYLLTKCICAGCGLLRAKCLYESTPRGAFGPQNLKMVALLPPPTSMVTFYAV